MFYISFSVASKLKVLWLNPSLSKVVLLYVHKFQHEHCKKALELG